MTRPDPSKNQDDWLADFTDQILNGGSDDLPADGAHDPELRALAETLLRLKRAFPNQEADPSAVKRMQKQVIHRYEQEKQGKSSWLDSIRQAWQTPHLRRQLVIAIAIIVLPSILFLTAPLIFSGNGSITATAGTGTSAMLPWILLILLGVCLGWLLRRKP